MTASRDELVLIVAEAMRLHYPTRGMAVTMGTTCECQHWTGSDRRVAPGLRGRDQLNLHRAEIAVDAMLGAIE